MNRIIAGVDKYNRLVYFNETKTNNHVAIWGSSGSGKTTWLDVFVLQLATLLFCKRIMRLAWHSCTQRDQRLPIISEALESNSFTVDPQEELRIKLFDPEKKRSKSRQEQSNEIDRLTEIIASSAKLPITQREAVLVAVSDVYHNTEKYVREGLRSVGENLLLLDAPAMHAYTKLRSVFKGANILYGDIDFVKPICELDLNDFSNTAQAVISNLVLAHFYELARKDEFVSDGFAVIIDEAQNADLREKQIISDMLMESRKKNVRLILATPQSLTNTKKHEAMLMCGTKLFFKPAGNEDKIARMIDPRHELDMILMLKQLKRGEFVAVGNFITEDGVEVSRPIKLSTYIPKEETDKFIVPDKAGKNIGRGSVCV